MKMRKAHTAIPHVRGKYCNGRKLLNGKTSPKQQAWGPHVDKRAKPTTPRSPVWLITTCHLVPSPL